MFIKPSIEEMKRTREFLKVEGILDITPSFEEEGLRNDEVD
jgi:hypothetical protein